MNEIYERFFELEGHLVDRNKFTHSTNFRTSRRKNKLMDEEVKKLKEVGINLSKNDLINICLDLVLNYEQKPEYDYNHCRMPNANLIRYIEENKEAILRSALNRLIDKDFSVATRPILTVQDKKNQRQQLNRIHARRQKLINLLPLDAK